MGAGGGKRGQLFILSPHDGLELTLRVTVKGWPGDVGVRERGAGSCLMKSAQASCSPIRLYDPQGATLSPCSPPRLLSTGPVHSRLSISNTVSAGNGHCPCPGPQPLTPPTWTWPLSGLPAPPPSSFSRSCPVAGHIFLEHKSDCVPASPLRDSAPLSRGVSSFLCTIITWGHLLRGSHIKSKIFWV